jgi:tetratricopeptide (TPR) repeat protein
MADRTLLLGWLARLFGRCPDKSVEAVTFAATDIDGQEAEHARAELAFQRGRKLFDAARYPEAVSCFEQSVEQKHDFADAHYYLGLSQHRQGRYEEASDAFAMALCFAPQMGTAYVALARAELGKGETREALHSTERAIQAGERGADVYKLRGELSFELGSMPDAVESYREALAASPDDALAHASLGYLLFSQCADYEAGAWHLERALELAPNDPIVQFNYTVLLMHRGELERTVALCEHLLYAHPGLQEVRLNKAIALLTMGRYDVAWEDYEARKTARGYPRRSRSFPEWQGSNLNDKGILIEAEQGLGDEIMFASCFGEIVECAGRCVIECSPRLQPLFARSFPAATVIASGACIDDALSSGIDFRVAAGSLPRFLRKSRAQFAQHQGYLHPDQDWQTVWRKRLDSLGRGMKIGLSWRGGILSTRHALRSVPLDELAALLRTGGCHFIDLQYGDTTAERTDLERATGLCVHHWDEAIDDLDQCAALISNLDLVISVCTAAVHMTGALGRPAWILVPSNPEWRYLADGEHMPWYPSATLIRQTGDGGWSAVITEVARRLAERVKSASARSRT